MLLLVQQLSVILFYVVYGTTLISSAFLHLTEQKYNVIDTYCQDIREHFEPSDLGPLLYL